MLGDTPKLRQQPGKEAMMVPTGVRVSLTDDVGTGVGDSQTAAYPLFLLDTFINLIAIGTENNTSITVGCNLFVGSVYIFAGNKSNLSVGLTDGCHDW